MCSIFLGGFSITLFSQNKLHVGFTQKQFIESLALNKDWHAREAARILWPLIYSQLWILGPAPEYQAFPGLAMNWETEDNRTWKFYLSPEAVFSDGNPVTAEDVIFSLELLPKLNPAWKSRDMNIESHEIIDDHTVEITLMEAFSGSYPPFYRKPILPKHLWKKYRNSPSKFPNSNFVGSGPYQLHEFKGGEQITLSRRENLTGIEAKYDELIFLSFADSQLMYSALKEGIIDLFGLDGIDPSKMVTFESIEGTKNIVTQGNELHWLSFNLAKNNVISDINVRRAIMHSINRKEIIAKVFRGYASEIDSFIYPELIDYHPGRDKYDYDPDKAVRILERSNYRDNNYDGIRDDLELNQDLSFSLLVLDNNKNHVTMANLLKEHLQQVGIQANLMKVAPFLYYSFLSNPIGGEFDLAINSRSPDPVTIDNIWNTMKSDEDLHNNFNSSHYINYAFDRILEKMLTTTSLLRRSKYLQLMQEIMTDDLPYGLLVRQHKICPVRNDDLHGFVKAMGGISSGINIWSYVNENVELNQESRSEGFELTY